MGLFMQSLFLLVATFVVNSNGVMTELWTDVIRQIDDCDYRTKVGDVLHMDYIGKLEDGTVFDSSVSRKQYFVFPIGKGKAIRGWELGLLDMCLYEQRYMIIPPDFAYGEAGNGDVIPGNATLYMNVILMKLERKDEL